jgi:hypothetical protein
MCDNLHASVYEIKLVSMRRVEALVGRLTPTAFRWKPVRTTAGLRFRVFLRSGAVSYQVVDPPRPC